MGTGHNPVQSTLISHYRPDQQAKGQAGGTETSYNRNRETQRPQHSPQAAQGSGCCLEGISQEHTVCKEVLVRPQGALSWALPLVGTHAILLRGARWCQHTVRSSKEAAQLRLQVVPYLAHLQERKKKREVRWVATTWSMTSRFPFLIWWHEHEVPQIALVHTPGSTA